MKFFTLEGALWFLRMTRVGIVQLCSGADKLANFNIYSKFIIQAAAKKCKVAFLPEAFDFIGTSSKETFSLAEPLNGELVTKLKDIARENKIWLSLGGYHQKLDEKVANTHVLIDSNGEVVQTYDKVHLFDAPLVGLEESKYVEGLDSSYTLLGYNSQHKTTFLSM